MCKILEEMCEESRQAGIKAGIEKGKAEGIQEGMEKTVLRMMKTGRFSIEDIADASGMPLEDIQKMLRA